MATKQPPLLYALDSNGVIKHIDEVERGEACKCICPACGKDLIAKKGDRRLKIHHFAHAHGVDCEYGYESSLHLEAKSILETAKKIVIPAVYVNFPYSCKKPVLFRASTEISIDSVELEVHLRNIIPDIVIRSGERTLIVEIFVTHAIDKDKLAKIENENISTIEIDLSDLDRNISLDELSHILLEDVQKKYWIYNAKETSQYDKFLDKSKKYAVKSIPGSISGSSANLVFDCPMPTRKWDGEMCADYWLDCTRCPYCIKVQNNKGDVSYVHCTGEECIAECVDFTIDKKERIEKNKDKTTVPFLDRVNKAKKLLDEGITGDCPNCGYAFREKEGKFGKFWGCYMYPHCKFAIWYDPEKEEYRYTNN